MSEYLKSVPGRILVATTALYFGAGGLAILLHGTIASDWLVAASILPAILGVHFAVGLALDRMHLATAAVIVAAPLQALATFPLMLIARDAGNVAIGSAFLAVGAGSLALLGVLSAARRTAPRSVAPLGARAASL